MEGIFVGKYCLAVNAVAAFKSCKYSHAAQLLKGTLSKLPYTLSSVNLAGNKRASMIFENMQEAELILGNLPKSGADPHAATRETEVLQILQRDFDEVKSDRI